MRDAVMLGSAPLDRDPVAEEPALIRAARVDSAAFGPLYELHRNRIYWYLLTRTQSAEDAADLLQQVFLQALDRISQYNPKKGPFIAWLFGIARNVASNGRRRQRTTVSWDLIPEALRGVSTDEPESQALQNESLAGLADVFATLDPDKRELLVLRYVVGLSFAEIAAIVGKNEVAARQQISRLLRALKEQYRDYA